MDPDWIARALAFGGLVVGLIAATVAFLNYRRDRPQLAIQWPGSESRELMGCFRLVVTNVGYRPIAITSVAIGTRPEGRLAWRLRFALFKHPRPWLSRLVYGLDRPPRGARCEINTDPLPLLLAPGDFKRFDFDGAMLEMFARSVASSVPPLSRLYAIVIDLRGDITKRPLTMAERRWVHKVARDHLERSSG